MPTVSTVQPPQPEKTKPKFIFLEKSSTIDSYESFRKEGFADLLEDYGDNNTNKVVFRHQQEMDFLNRVDLKQGPILVTVLSVVRTMAVDLESPKKERREYLYYSTDWEAKDWLGNIIKCPHESEGHHIQQTKEKKVTFNPKTGQHVQEYIRGTPRDAYTIPWDKKYANELLTSEKIFGADSINITNLAEVQFVVKFPNGNPGRTGFGMQDWLDLPYDKLQKLSTTVKSPYLADLQRKTNPYG